MGVRTAAESEWHGSHQRRAGYRRRYDVDNISFVLIVIYFGVLYFLSVVTGEQ